MSLSDFEILKQLGKGAFGSVNLVRRKKDLKTYAMKRIRLTTLSQKEKETALNEIRILASLNHKNIIGYKESFIDESSNTLNIIMEYADDGDIESKIKENIKKRLYFSENTIWNWVIQILEGIYYLHSNKIMHRDLKGANIFLMKNGILKLGDLGVSKIAKMGFAQTQTGTPYYCAPEIWKEQPYNDKCDIWSLGCIIYEICSLRPPFKGTSFKNLYYNISLGKYYPIPHFYSEELGKLISMMIVVDARRRANAENLINCDIVKKRIKGFYENGKKALLIQTIKMPRNIRDINQKLPKARYEEKEMMKDYDRNNGNNNRNSNNVNGNNYNENVQINKVDYNVKYGQRDNQYNPYNNNNQFNQNRNNNQYNPYNYFNNNYHNQYNENRNNNPYDNRNNNNNYPYNQNYHNKYNDPSYNQVKSPNINKYDYLNKYDNNMKLKNENIQFQKAITPKIYLHQFQNPATRAKVSQRKEKYDNNQKPNTPMFGIKNNNNNNYNNYYNQHNYNNRDYNNYKQNQEKNLNQNSIDDLISDYLNQNKNNNNNNNYNNQNYNNYNNDYNYNKNREYENNNNTNKSKERCKDLYGQKNIESGRRTPIFNAPMYNYANNNRNKYNYDFREQRNYNDDKYMNYINEKRRNDNQYNNPYLDGRGRYNEIRQNNNYDNIYRVFGQNDNNNNYRKYF